METYEDLRQTYRKLFEDHNDRFEFYQEGINLLDLIIQDATQRRNEEYKKTKKSLRGSPAITQFYLLVIRDSFRAHYHLIKSGFVRPSFSPLRTIYETILKTYLCDIYPEIGKINYENEVLDLMPSILIKEKEEINHKLESLPISTEQRENIKKNIEKKYINAQDKEYINGMLEIPSIQTEQKEYIKRHIHKKYIKTQMKNMAYLGMSYVERRLYNEDTQKSLRDFYHSICKLVHPSIKSLNSSFEFDEKVFLDSADVGICMLASAFALTFEIHWDYIELKYKKRFLNMYEKFPLSAGLAEFFPSNNTDRLRFKDYDSLLEELKQL